MNRSRNLTRRRLLQMSGLAGALALAPWAARPLHAAEKLIITAIPDDGDADRMREHFGLLARYLGEAVGRPVEYMHVQNYAASVTALATGRAHVAWLGAVTTAQAWQLMGDDLTVLGCRDIDKGFVTYFVAHHGADIPAVADLGELAELARDRNWTFTFGSRSSTSSHLMPRKFFMDQSGTTPERVFRRVAYSGSHDVVMQMVAQGSYTLGAMNYASWDRASDELKARAPIVYRTPAFTNYALTARADLGEDLLGRLRSALLDLSDGSEAGRRILGYLGAGAFIPAELSEWADYKALLESGIDIGS
ncbi:MAG: phosphate/phosphite/phosphonate ABC transporter substrate-binding protein [Gammaproteobacteria bacterium]|nr:phosphate/phosphite/phosphonate ABC transporter substrate-binding protein [Gammaproteobacteria bacterium]